MGLSLQDAYSVTASIRALRERRGVRVVGRKIGFTNRAIWQQYDVYAPVWGYMYDTTVHDYRDDAASARVPWEFEPRIEPEIVFGLAHTPSSGMDERALLDCVDWVAQGFEIVASMFFAAGLSLRPTRLRVSVFTQRFSLGRSSARVPIQSVGSAHSRIFKSSSAAMTSLWTGGTRAMCSMAPFTPFGTLPACCRPMGRTCPLGAGEIVTTGTLTRAMPVSRGERWSAVLSGIALEGIGIDFA